MWDMSGPMKETRVQPLPQDEPAFYRIQVHGLVDERMRDWFEDMQVTTESREEGKVISCLSGMVADQAALHGILDRIYTFGYMILSVIRVTR
jgi:hypothetical protein